MDNASRKSIKVIGQWDKLRSNSSHHGWVHERTIQD